MLVTMMHTGIPIVRLYENVGPGVAGSGKVELASGFARRDTAGTALERQRPSSAQAQMGRPLASTPPSRTSSGPSLPAAPAS